MIRFLGVPCAHFNQQQAHLRSKETWGVLASLLLPSVLRRESPCQIARETLADRFWADSPLVPRTHLRQCLTSLRDAFGENCLITDRHDVQIATGWFVTDIERALYAYRKAKLATTIEERLHWLGEAEQEIRGEFFEGWTPDSDEAQVWLIQLRADIRSQILPILLLLTQTLEEADNLNGAFAIVRRILQFQPAHKQARKKAWDLALATGQQDVMTALEQTESFREAVSKFPTGGLPAATLRDGRLFQSLFEAELNHLPPALQKAVLRLSFLPAPFSKEIAEAACQTPLTVLKALAQTPFLEQEGDTFVMPSIVRDCAWKRVPSLRRHLLQKQLARFCIATFTAKVPPPEMMPSPFEDRERARPFLRSALEWVLEQKPTAPYLTYINLLRYWGLADLAQDGIVYLQKAAEDASFPVERRIDTRLSVSYIHMANGKHNLAVLELEAAVPLATSLPEGFSCMSVYGTLSMACHYAGYSERALTYGLQALPECRKLGALTVETHVLRFIGEIYTQLGDFTQALQHCAEALRLRQERGETDSQIADALYWKAKCLFRLTRWEEAADTVERALTIWQEEKDLTGIGFCLRLLGEIRRAEGRYGEARAHQEHSILLHEKTGIEVNRLASVEALADIFLVTQKHNEAHHLYQECLDFYTAKSLQTGMERLNEKMALSLTTNSTR